MAVFLFETLSIVLFIIHYYVTVNHHLNKSSNDYTFSLARPGVMSCALVVACSMKIISGS